MPNTIFRNNSPELKAYWNGISAGTLLLPHCHSCGQVHWYPRGICPHCLSIEIEPREASGIGILRSFTYKPGAETAIAYVTLAEGPTLLTRIHDTHPTALEVGQSVKLAPQATIQVGVPIFRMNPCRDISTRPSAPLVDLVARGEGFPQ